MIYLAKLGGGLVFTCTGRKAQGVEGAWPMRLCTSSLGVKPRAVINSHGVQTGTVNSHLHVKIVKNT